MTSRKTNVVEYRVYDLPLDFASILLYGEEWRISDVLSNRLHFHNCFEIGLCHTDSGILVFEDQTLPFRAGDVTCIPRHIPHTTCSDKATRSRWSYVFLDLEQMTGMDGLSDAELGGPAVAPDRYWVLDRGHHPRIHFLVTSIVEEMAAQRPNYRPVVRHMLSILRHDLIRLQQAQADGEPGKPKHTFRLKPAFEHIANHYKQPIGVDELARLCELSTTHFRRLFAAVVGDSPISFLNTTRVNRACAMLLTTENSILSIAEAVGFSTISSFNRYFLSVMGVSPRQYRNPAIRDSIHPKRKYVVRYKGWMKPEARPESTNEPPVTARREPPFVPKQGPKRS